MRLVAKAIALCIRKLPTPNIWAICTLCLASALAHTVKKPRQLIDSSKANGEYHDMTSFRYEMVEHLKEKYNVPKKYNTVPLVFKNKTFIGGCSELMIEMEK